MIIQENKCMTSYICFDLETTGLSPEKESH